MKVFEEEDFKEVIEEKDENELRNKWWALCDKSSFKEKIEAFFKNLRLNGFISIAYWSYLRSRLLN